MHRYIHFALSACLPGALFAQMTPIDAYMNTETIRQTAQSPAPRIDRDVQNTLPLANSQRFAAYVAASTPAIDQAALRQAIEDLRLNKLVGNTVSGGGTTSLVSRVAVPGLLGIATEFGGVLQSTTGMTTTLRGNLLGITRMAFGNEQFPFCTEADQSSCPKGSQWLRRFSGAISFETTSTAAGGGTAATSSGSRVPVTALFGTDYRMSSWGLRFDLTRNDPDDPAYAPRWGAAIAALKTAPESAGLLAAVESLFSDASGRPSPVYGDWTAAAGPLLKNAPSEEEYKRILAEQLDLLIVRMAAANVNFAARVAALRRGFLNYAAVRDDILRAIQSNKVSFEYTNQHPANQFSTSNFRFIYSHTPSRSQTLVTANAAMTFYNALPVGGKGRFRDFQLAGQLDRRLGEIANLGNAVATFGAYYQWMAEDALIKFGPGNTAPGSAITLPGTAATLLGTKGHIGIVQGKLTIPAGSVVKIPLSVTWSNRTELINQKDIRGQVGLTIDLDSIFKR
ncbi:MAG: hypothetical protein FJW39_11665 [Acidobacteria bacterium]|nr:hypothetical protein [Acidobacteriota bacterium]